MSRRLAAILVADIVGYSRLMGADEAGTLGRFAALRRTVIDPAIAAHGGRIFKTMGDALLVEFSSAVDAVTCALALIEGMAAADEPDPLRFRFGVHVGDVIDQDGDLFGDAVNVAARVEAQAEPGGIVLTEDAARYVRGKIGAELADLGERVLKNIAAPQRLFAIGGAPQPAPDAQPATHGAVGRPPALRLVALRHMGDPTLAYITEGLNDGLASALAPFQFFVVVDGDDTDFTFTGSVQIAGPRLRIAVALAEQRTGRRVWGTTFERTTDDPFALQDDLIATIASALGEAIPEEAARALAGKPADTWTAHDHVIAALQHLHRLDAEGCQLGHEAVRRALAIDPGNDLARLVLAWLLAVEASLGHDPEPKLAEAAAIVQDIVRRDDRSSAGWRLLSRIAAKTGRIDEAIAYARRSSELNPYDTDVLVTLGVALARAGQAEEGVAHIERALKINAYAPAYYKAELALARYVSGDVDGALAALNEISRPVTHSRPTRIAVLVALDRMDEAMALAAAHLAEEPGATAGSLSPLANYPGSARYHAALVAAGIPE